MNDVQSFWQNGDCLKNSRITLVYGNFFHYKYMETLSCHSKESTRATTIKNTIYVDANVMNIYAKFQLHPPYGFWDEDFWLFFSKI